MNDMEVSDSVLEEIDSLLGGEEGALEHNTQAAADNSKDISSDNNKSNKELLADELEELGEESPETNTPEKVTAEEQGENQEPEEEEDKIDYDLMIPMPDGEEPIKLGDMKDLVNDSRRRDDLMTERENALMREQDDWAQVMQYTGAEVPPEVRQMMEQRQYQHLEQEQGALIKAMPELSDNTEFLSMKKRVVGVGSEYGFSEQELFNVTDHRVIKFMNDYGKLMERNKVARETVAQIKGKAPVKSRPRRIQTKASNVDKQFSEALSSNNREDKFAAMDALLGNG